MKTFAVLLLVAVLFTERGHSLLCYTCSEECANCNCQKIAKCAETDKFCMTTAIATDSGNGNERLITKGCSPVCFESTIDSGVARDATTCCNSSLCNQGGTPRVRRSKTNEGIKGGAPGVKMSGAVVAAGMVAAFFYVFRPEL